MRILIAILAFLSLASGARAAPCGELFAFGGSWVEGLAEDECVLRQSFDLGVGGVRRTYKIYDARASRYSGSAWHLEAAREALERSAPFYGRAAPTPGAVIIFAGGAPRTDAGDGGSRAVLGETQPKIFGDTCVLAITDAALDGRYGNAEGERELRLTIAHELFHCVQYLNWSRKTQDAMFEHAKWWMEGTAEYIQHEVYPEYAFEGSRAPDFDAQIGAQGLLGAEHANAVFFAYYARMTSGAASVVSFIERMASVPGREVQVSALSGVTGIATHFQFFARNYYDRDLQSPGAHVIDVNPRDGVTIRITEPGEREVKVQPLKLRKLKFHFPRGENWKITVRSDDGGLRNGLRYDETPGDWREGTFEVLACASERMVLAANTLVERIEEERTLRFRFERLAGDARTCPCPYGAWTVTPEDINKYYPLPSIAVTDGETAENKGWRFKWEEGAPRLDFRRDGTAQYTHVLVFKTDRKPVRVPANCTSGACVRACMSGRQSPRYCGEKRTVYHRWMAKEDLELKWTWRRDGDRLVRAVTGGAGATRLFFNDGFSWQFVKETPRRVVPGSQSGNPYRCAGSDLILDPTPASGSAASLDDLIMMLERGNAQQRAAAAQLRALKDRPGGDAIARQMMDRMAAGEASGTIAYPFSGRFVR